MRLENNTVLITGGSSGLGLELAKRLVQQSKVLICGRSLVKLEQTKKEIPEIDFFQCDVSVKKECQNLVEWISINHPECNILVNNAAITHVANFYEDDKIIDKAVMELNINLLAPITLSKLLIPILTKNSNASIINITSGLVFVPRVDYPFYNATKAALHSFTQVLRIQLRKLPVSVVEVMFPAVDTPWHNGNPPKIAISPEKAIDEMLIKLKKGELEIKIGKVKILRMLTRLAPSFAFKKLNQLTSTN